MIFIWEFLKDLPKEISGGIILIWDSLKDLPKEIPSSKIASLPVFGGCEWPPARAQAAMLTTTFPGPGTFPGIEAQVFGWGSGPQPGPGRAMLTTTFLGLGFAPGWAAGDCHADYYFPAPV